LVFDGRFAEIVEMQEANYLATWIRSNFVLTIDARMPDGELYRFKSDSNGKPWVLCRSRQDEQPMRAKVPF
jgi:hypothetical protein